MELMVNLVTALL